MLALTLESTINSLEKEYIMTMTKAIFAAALCFGLAACSTTDTMNSSGASDSSATGSTTSGSSSMDSGTAGSATSGSSTSGSSASGSTSSGQWNQSGTTSPTATPGTSPTTPSNADDNSVKK